MAFCSNCGKQIQEGAKFCPNCGAPVSGTASPAQPTQKPSTTARKGKKGKTVLLILLAIVIAVGLATLVEEVKPTGMNDRDSVRQTRNDDDLYSDFVGSRTDLDSGTMQSGDLSAETQVVKSPRLPSPDVWLGGRIKRSTDSNERLYRKIGFTFDETGARAAEDAISGYLDLLQTSRFNLKLIDSKQKSEDGVTTNRVYYFSYTGSGSVGDLTSMGVNMDIGTYSKVPEGTAVMVSVTAIMQSSYSMNISYVSDFDLVDEGDTFSDASYLKEHVSGGYNFSR